MIQISPSLLAADFCNLSHDTQRIARAGADFLHLDVMDGVFVPNISFGVPVIEALRRVSSLCFDVHLMIEDPLAYIDAFAGIGADYITFHYESKSDPQKTIDRIHALGKKAGMSIKPGTPAEALLPYVGTLELLLVMSVEPGFGGQKFRPEILPKLTLLSKKAPSLLLSVDGGINKETGRLCTEAGANMLVAGSYVFGASDPAEAISSLRG